MLTTPGYRLLYFSPRTLPSLQFIFRLFRIFRPLNTKRSSQGIGSSYLSIMFLEDINILLKSIVLLAYRWRNMALAKKLWLKADYCFTITPSDGFVYYLTFKWCLMPSVYIIELHYYTYDNFCVPKIKYITHN